MVKSGIDISLEHAFQLGSYRSAHQVERIHREKWIPDIGLDVKALQKAIGFDLVEFTFVLDAGERFGGRAVVGGFEDAAEQNRHIFELHADARLDRRDRLMAQESVGAAEIEEKLWGGNGHG